MRYQSETQERVNRFARTVLLASLATALWAVAPTSVTAQVSNNSAFPQTATTNTVNGNGWGG